MHRFEKPWTTPYNHRELENCEAVTESGQEIQKILKQIRSRSRLFCLRVGCLTMKVRHIALASLITCCVLRILVAAAPAIYALWIPAARRLLVLFCARVPPVRTTSADSKPLQFAVAYFHTDPTDDLLALSIPNKKEYCKLHNYHCFDGSDHPEFVRGCEEKGVKNPRNIYLCKELLISYITKALPEIDWILFQDLDVYITSPQNKLEDLVGTLKKDTFVACGRDEVSMNAGTMFLKNSKEGREFLDEWREMNFVCRNDQVALVSVYNQKSRKVGNSGCISTFESRLELYEELPGCYEYPAPGLEIIPNWKIGPWAGLEAKKYYGIPYSPVLANYYADGDFSVHLAGVDKSKVMHQLAAGQTPVP